MLQEYMEEIISVKNRIASVRKEDSLVFPLFSDLHTDGVDSQETLNLLDVLSLISKQISPNAVIDLGDNTSMLGRNCHITNQQLIEVLTKLFDAIHSAADVPLFLVNGNHDAIGTDFFKPAIWNQIIRNKYDGGMAKTHPHGSYYYVDYEKAKLRMVFLSVPYESNLNAANPTPVWAFGEEQLKWLQDVALDTANRVILFSHVPLYYRYRGDMNSMLDVWDGEKTAKSYICDLCGWIDDAKDAAAIIEKRGNVVACFSGHTHEDSFWLPYERRGEDINYLSCCQVVTTRAVQKKSRIAIDILVWNPTEREIHIVRFGDGEDRKIEI